MLGSFIENVVLGFVISAVPGAVFFEVFRRSLLRSADVYWFLAGNFCGMSVVASGAYVGVQAIADHDFVTAAFHFVSAGLLLYIGGSALLANTAKPHSATSSSNAQHGKSFVSGLTLAVANPLSIAFWLSLTGKFLREQTSQLDAIINSAAVVIGAVVLFGLLVGATKIIGLKLRPSYLALLTKLTGGILILYGLASLYSAIQAL